jgi:Zn-dependent protease
METITGEGNLEEPIALEDRAAIFTRAVGKILRVEDVTWGTAKTRYIVRYRGRLYSEDSAAAYDKLAADLKPFDVTPLFRMDDQQHAVEIIRGITRARPSRIWVNLVLFIVTLFSVFLTGFLYSYEGSLPGNFLQLAADFFKFGWPFALSLIAILGTHEFGHYLVGRHHGLNVTLPYFIPLPFSFFGTMGAFINMKSIPKNRRILLDVGIAGPLAGLAVAIPVLLVGLHLSSLGNIPSGITGTPSMQLEGNSILYLLSKYIIFGKTLPQPINYGSISPVIYWLRYFFTGHPLPLGGLDVMLHPVAWAGWAGMLVTGLNLLPVGQLDGGHVIYTLFGAKWSRRMYPVILVILVGLGFFWPGWWLWAFLLFFLGRFYAEPLDQITPLDPKRKLLGYLAIVAFVLTFIPVPLIIF